MITFDIKFATVNQLCYNLIKQLHLSRLRTVFFPAIPNDYFQRIKKASKAEKNL